MWSAQGGQQYPGLHDDNNYLQSGRLSFSSAPHRSEHIWGPVPNSGPPVEDRYEHTGVDPVKGHKVIKAIEHFIYGGTERLGNFHCEKEKAQSVCVIPDGGDRE